MSGAGKTQALKCLEDLGYFCIDNLPVGLVPRFADLITESDARIKKVAMGIDIRIVSTALTHKTFAVIFSSTLNLLRSRGIDYRVVFLDADNPVLIKRFSETRRKHPLGKNIISGISEERKQLTPIRALADKIINTSNITLSQLKETLSELVEIKVSKEMIINVVSFGYKFGLPLDADIALDVRFLPNPAYVDRLKKLTGTSERVRKFIKSKRITRRFLKKLFSLLAFLLPNFVKEGKSYLTIAVGCTGGRHRSVVMAQEIKEHLLRKNYTVRVAHRDIDK